MSSVLVGMGQNRVQAAPFSEIVGDHKPIEPELIDLARGLDK